MVRMFVECGVMMNYSRNGKAERISCDHKASDPEEKKRVEAGQGFIIQNKVGGK